MKFRNTCIVVIENPWVWSPEGLYKRSTDPVSIPRSPLLILITGVDLKDGLVSTSSPPYNLGLNDIKVLLLQDTV